MLGHPLLDGGSVRGISQPDGGATTHAGLTCTPVTLVVRALRRGLVKKKRFNVCLTHVFQFCPVSS